MTDSFLIHHFLTKKLKIHFYHNLKLKQQTLTGAREAVYIHGPTERGTVEPQHHDPRAGQRDTRSEASGVRVS